MSWLNKLVEAFFSLWQKNKKKKKDDPVIVIPDIPDNGNTEPDDSSTGEPTQWANIDKMYPCPPSLKLVPPNKIKKASVKVGYDKETKKPVGGMVRVEYCDGAKPPNLWWSEGDAHCYGMQFLVWKHTDGKLYSASIEFFPKECRSQVEFHNVFKDDTPFFPKQPVPGCEAWWGVHSKTLRTNLVKLNWE